MSKIEELCITKGIKMTEQRRVVATVISQSDDHPDVEELYNRAVKIDPNISIPTVYRTVRLFEEMGIIEKHDFKDNRARYEGAREEKHYHLIDLKTGKVIEFKSEEIEKLKQKIAHQLGYELIDDRLELYGIPLKE
ncbi:Ferric uptake regulation protein [Rickettsiales bacterium Ac37b]|nr:Ferric uptake regulation protein [Rickettsiales bacterium Ac37b]